MASEQAAAKRASSRRGLGGSQAALDHYKLLGLERSVTSDEVRTAVLDRRGSGAGFGGVRCRAALHAAMSCVACARLARGLP